MEPGTVPLNKATFAVVDTETTGFRAGLHRVIEAAAVKVVGGAVVDSWSSLINPGVPVPRRITSITGITNELLTGRPSFDEIWPDLGKFLEGCIVVAHNVPFDRSFLSSECRLSASDFPGNPWLCTLRLSRRLLPGLQSRALPSVARHFGIVIRERHRALGDAEATACILERLCYILSHEFGIETVEQLLRFQYSRYTKSKKEAPHVSEIRQQILPGIPSVPGVYKMLDRNDRIIYIGKARDLQTRVKSYFSAIEVHDARIRQLVRSIRKIEYEELPSELHALVRESVLIKKIQPRFNRALKASKDHPFIRLDRNGSIRLTVVTHLGAGDADYFGPLADRDEAECIARLLGRLFDVEIYGIDDQRLRQYKPYRDRRPVDDWLDDLQPLDGDPEPCATLRQVLCGRAEEVLPHLVRQMSDAASTLDYERAGWYRDAIRCLVDFCERQKLFGSPVMEANAVLVHQVNGTATLLSIIRGLLADCTLLASGDQGALDAAVREFHGRHIEHAARMERTGMNREDVDQIRIVSAWVYRQREFLHKVHPESIVQSF